MRWAWGYSGRWMCIVLSLVTADVWFLPSNVSFLYLDVLQHCQRVKPIIDLVHKVISTDVSIADCLLPITSRIYMLLQRWVTDLHGVTNSRDTWEDIMSWKSCHLPILPEDLKEVHLSGWTPQDWRSYGAFWLQNALMQQSHPSFTFFLDVVAHINSPSGHLMDNHCSLWQPVVWWALPRAVNWSDSRERKSWQS